MKTHSVVLVTLTLWLPSLSLAQVPPHLSDEAQISLLTILPGQALYSAFGHSALRVNDPVAGIDLVFNYGTFDFTDPLFIPRFIYGKLDYFLSVSRYRANLEASKNEHRPIIEQTLNLSRVQMQAVYDRLLWNARPPNRVYRYDFLFDNCSTRLRDILESALGQSIRFPPLPNPQKSFRHLLDPYVANRPIIDFGFDLLIGHPTDRVATPREVVFLPDELFLSMTHAVLDSSGISRPLVARTDTLLWIQGYKPVQPSFPWMMLFFGALVLVLGGLTVRTTRHPSRKPFWLDIWIFGIIGAIGLFLIFMWFGTEHPVTKDNWNILWALPTHIILAYLLSRGKFLKWLPAYLYLSAVLLLLSFSAFLTNWPQTFHVAMLPLMLLLLWRSLFVANRLRSVRDIS